MISPAELSMYSANLIFEVRISRSVSEGPFDFEITRVDLYQGRADRGNFLQINVCGSARLFVRSFLCQRVDSLRCSHKAQKQILNRQDRNSNLSIWPAYCSFQSHSDRGGGRVARWR